MKRGVAIIQTRGYTRDHYSLTCLSSGTFPDPTDVEEGTEAE